MDSRSWLLVAVLVAVPLAGCVGPSADDPADPAAVPAVPVADDLFTHLRCAGDELVRLVDGPSEACNVLVTDGNGPAAEVHLAVNPLDPDNLIGGSKDFTLGEDPRCGIYNVWSGIYWSKDGGRTWTHDLIPGHPGDDRTTALSDYACGSDPILVFDGAGVAYYVGIYLTQDPDAGDAVSEAAPQSAVFRGYPILNSALAVTRSLDGGETWEDPVILASRADGALIDKEWAAVDPNTGQIYVSYIVTNGDGFFTQRSDDGGLTWTEPAPIEPPAGAEGDPSQSQFGQIVVGSDGVVHFTFWGQDDEDISGVYHRSSSDQGASWSEAHLVATYYPVFNLEFTHKYRIVPNPALAIDPYDNTLYVNYPFYNGPDMDILVARSMDGGESWQNLGSPTGETFMPQNGQWLNAIAVGPDRTVHMTWLDYRDDPSGQGARVYYTNSTNGGESWAPGRAISSTVFDGTGGYHQSGAGTIGDYMGLAASTTGVTAFWADTRNERNDVFSAFIPGSTLGRNVPGTPVMAYDGAGAPLALPATPATPSFVLTGHAGAEPNMGITKSGAIFASAYDEVIKSTDGGATWEQVFDFAVDGAPFDPKFSADPMLWVDPVTDIIYEVPMWPILACGYFVTSEDDGETWQDRSMWCPPAPMDHQKVASGVPGPDAPAVAGNQHPTVLYFCYNQVASTVCSASYDGGVTWPVTEPIWAVNEGTCNGVPGHPAASHDGVIAVGKSWGCDALYVAISTDSGLTWALKKGPEIGGETIDPDLTWTPDGSLYALWQAGDHLTYLARSDDQGDSWAGPWRVSPPDVGSTVFAGISSGDDGRVAMSYIGTRDSTSYGSWVPSWARWHLFITVTEDGTQDEPSFTTYQVTPDEDPVQVGCVWIGGGGNPCRNMLDFIDTAVSEDGTFHVVYTEGCTDGCAGELLARAHESRDDQTALARLDGWSLFG